MKLPTLPTASRFLFQRISSLSPARFISSAPRSNRYWSTFSRMPASSHQELEKSKSRRIRSFGKRRAVRNSPDPADERRSHDEQSLNAYRIDIRNTGAPLP